jgi:hypothetical protein
VLWVYFDKSPVSRLLYTELSKGFLNYFMRQETFTFLIPTLLIALLAYFIQTKMFFSPDVGYLLHAANQVLAGGKYGTDIFETNPPMILYLYLPVCWLAKWTAISVVILVRIYVIGLVLISLGFCFSLLRRLIHQQDRVLLYFLFYTLLFILFFLPLFVFAQREHLLMIFMLPYLFSTALFLEKQPLHPGAALLIGVLAGLVFALKPFFLFVPCFIELYCMVKMRSLFAWVRIEPMVILSVLVLYLYSIFLLQPDYINVILPMVFHYYFPAMVESWQEIIGFPNVLFCCAVIAGYFIYYPQDRYPTLGIITLLALLGMIFAFLVPRTPWYYHVLPAFGLAWLLLADFFGQVVSAVNLKKMNRRALCSYVASLMAAAVIVLAVPVNYCYQLLDYIHRFQQQQVVYPLAKYINAQAGEHSIACFALGTPDCFPLVYFIHGQYSERFPSFWWYKELRRLDRNSALPMLLAAQVQKDKRYLLESIAIDLNRYQTKWIIINQSRFQEGENKPFNIISYFAKNEKFRTAWQHYHYSAIIGSDIIYERNRKTI